VLLLAVVVVSTPVHGFDNPTVSTGGVEPGVDHAEMQGAVTDLGAYDSVEVGFQWRKQGETLWHTEYTAGFSRPGEFTLTKYGLDPGTTYEYRVIVNGEYGTTKGGIRSFTTKEADALEGNTESSGEEESNDVPEEGDGEESEGNESAGENEESGAEDDEDDEDKGEGWVGNFRNGIADSFKTALQDFLIGAFNQVLTTLVNAVPQLLTYTPDVYPNPAVEELHGQTLIVAVSLSGIGIAVIGILYIMGPIFGISYAQVRPLLARLIVALVFATISLPLLQYGVDFTNALTTAFTPETITVQELAGMGTGMLIVYLVNSALLLGVAAMFIIRDVYILFVAAISPLLAIVWVFPRAQRYADTFISGWFAALLMAPLDMLVFKFLTVMLSLKGAALGPAVGNWLFGVAGFLLLIMVPWQLYGASQAGVGMGYMMARRAVTRTPRKIKEYRAGDENDGSPPGYGQRRYRYNHGNSDGGSNGSSATPDGGSDRLTERRYNPDADLEDNRFYNENVAHLFNDDNNSDEENNNDDEGEQP
jgi:hypothetical protein